ncbi:MAG TPA: glycosyltransferase [Candidatus Acidoferrum sp.]|jgi:glycosyltransferase involved in cell wall biosynthesis
MKPLVSILIPAYNAENWIEYTIRSALDQTWKRKEIIIVDDGSTDGTADVAKLLATKEVRVVSTVNQGLSAAVNHAYRLCQGDYIQELDSDDLMAPDKIERQLAALRETDSKRILLSSPWAHFYYRTRTAQFVRNSFWQDLTPVEWLLRKMGENLHMQNATWLVSRELADAAGPWDTSLHYDQDGEYFARVLLASEGTRFVPEGRVFYRANDGNRISFIGKSRKKKKSLLRSMKLHIQYIRSLEDSERVRKACLTYMQNWYGNFYPDETDAIAELQALAAELQGHLEIPSLRRKYAWMTPVFGRPTADWAQRVLPELKTKLKRNWDKRMFEFEARRASSTR